MALRFPWLDCEYPELPDWDACELFSHELEVKVNTMGKAIVAFEKLIVECAQEQNVEPDFDNVLDFHVDDDDWVDEAHST